MLKRGRPKEPEHVEAPRKFKREYVDDEGIKSTWKYDLDKVPNGPIEVDYVFPPHYKPLFEQIEERNKVNSKIPLKYQTFINPKNGKKVGYQRAKNLGLI